MNMGDLRITSKITKGGRIVIPAKFREALGMEVGQNVTLSVTNDELRVISSKAALRRLQTLVRKHVPEGVSLVDELIRERREEAANE